MIKLLSLILKWLYKVNEKLERKSDFGNKWLSGSLLKWGELKNRKWDLNEHLISAIDLNLFQPLDLEITQKSFGVILREEKEENITFDSILLWADWEKESKRAIEISEQGGEGDNNLAHIPRQQLSRFVQLIQHTVKDRFWHNFRGEVCTKIEEQFASFSTRKTRAIQQHLMLKVGTKIEETVQYLLLSYLL